MANNYNGFCIDFTVTEAQKKWMLEFYGFLSDAAANGWEEDPEGPTFLQSGFPIPNESDRRASWDWGPDFDFEAPKSPTGSDLTTVYISSHEESGNVENASWFLAECQQKFPDFPSLIITWADWCSKLRPGEFSGGGVAISRGRRKWFVPYQLCSKWIDRQTKKEQGKTPC